MPKEQQSFSVAGFVIFYQRVHSFSSPLFKHLVTVSGLKTEQDKTLLKNFTPRIQTSGISLRTTQKQVHEDTKILQCSRRLMLFYAEKNPGYFSATDCSATEDDS